MDFEDFKQLQTRRSFFRDCAGGVGTIALWHLLAREGRAGSAEEGSPNINPLALKTPHFLARTKNVIFLFMDGGPSQVDLFDPKPEMKKWEGQSLPPSMTKGLKLAFIKPTAKVWASPRSFQPYGQSGTEFSDWMPYIASRADDICMIRSMYTEQFNHHPAQIMLQCGSPLVGRPHDRRVDPLRPGERVGEPAGFCRAPLWGHLSSGRHWELVQRISPVHLPGCSFPEQW